MNRVGKPSERCSKHTNIVSIHPVGAILPLALSLLYLPRSFNALGWFHRVVFLLSLMISTFSSYCDARAVHVVPGTVLMCVVLWLPRARGRNREVPAAAIFALTFIAGFPVDVYLGYVCRSAGGTATVGGAGRADGLLLGLAILAGVHCFVYYFCEHDEKKGKVPIGAFLKWQLAPLRPRPATPDGDNEQPSIS